MHRKQPAIPRNPKHQKLNCFFLLALKLGGWRLLYVYRTVKPAQTPKPQTLQLSVFQRLTPNRLLSLDSHRFGPGPLPRTPYPGSLKKAASLFKAAFFSATSSCCDVEGIYLKGIKLSLKIFWGLGFSICGKKTELFLVAGQCV